ncbi:cytochrome P450 705A20-like [Corylus avellana]|uniref:cytochrome P450 705A20-like n=1 Tax=Corylus avellana TaxID=13451 RepID=UPI00286A4DD9|nr:cytochrome P450 705A20-like [Corylus avellana]
MTVITQYLLLIFFCFLLPALLLILFFNKPTTTGRRSRPPSPPALPIIGHLHLVGGFFHKSLQNLATQYGSIFYIRLGFSDCIVVSSAAMANEIFKTHDLDFAQHPKITFADELPYARCGFFSAPYGDYYRFIKKLCMTELLSPRQLERSRVVRDEELGRFLRGLVESGKKKEVVNVGAELMKLTNNTICTMAMSTRCSEKGDDADRIRGYLKIAYEIGSKGTGLIGDALGPLSRLVFWLYRKETMDYFQGVDELLERMLKEHEDQIGKRENEDLMDILLKVYRDDKAEAKIMSRTHLKAFLYDIFVGASGTLAEAIVWVMAELINHPNVFQKLREEIRSVVGSTRLVEESDVASLPYLQAVVKETLRLYPPLPVTTRECRQSCQIEGYDIPQKTAVGINLYAIMRDPEIWDNPNEFLPERFMVSDDTQHKNMEHKQDHGIETFLTFGAGRRGCPGSRLGLIMMHLTVAAMVQCFDWKFCGDEHNGKINMEVGKGLFIHLAQPLTCLPVLHFNPFAASI